ncbi:MAG: type I DNA topoisomerase [Chloroflexi bacterium]|nr:type I DNA topoisomerase [Chloroflexota bacterium]MYF21223.1 type I DNA topoisomerase [Chloroflexota bacterium]
MPDAERTATQDGKTLVIVESGAKAETISRFLDDDYLVTACFGHIRDLPRRAAERPAKIKGKPWADFSVDVDHGFQPYYIVPGESKKHVTRLRKELKQADRVLLATDEDREGESIGWHLVEVLKPKVPYERIVFHEITASAIEAALESPRQIDEHLVEAQESRRIIDRLYGYSLSPVLWRKLGQGTSAGRVQSVALKFLVDRERERMAFVSAEYWGANTDFLVGDTQLSARLHSLGGSELASQTSDFDPATGLLAATEKRWETEQSLTELQPALTEAQWTVATVAKTQARMRPAPPFTTSTMQQAASNRLGMGSARAMAAAQRLYQGVDLGAERVGLITYMRTDSVTLSDQALAQASSYIKSTYGEDYHQFRTYKTRSRNAQEAHEAIRPTDIARTPDSLRGVVDGDDLALYELVWCRAVASQMADARVERTRIELEARLPARSNDDPAVIVANGQVVVFPGWYEVLPPRGDGQQLLPDVAEGERARLVGYEPRQSESQPPARFTEASLVKKLEDDGLGRPSTYAAIIKTLIDRSYVNRSGRTLIPTFLGFAVTDLLTQHFSDLVNAEFTAEMEEHLDQIARGETRSEEHLRAFYFGDVDAANGLKGRVAEKIDTIPFWALNLTTDGLTLDTTSDDDQIGPDDVQVRVRGGQSFLRRGAGDGMRTAPLPPDIAPADLTLEKATDLLDTTMQLPRRLGRHPEADDDVWLLNGRFGPFVQIGEVVGRPKRGAPKPRRASVPSGMEIAEVNLEHAIEWLRWPKTLGLHPDTGEEVVVRPGRWGPYVQSGDERRNLKDDDDLETIELDRALTLLAEPRPQRRGRGRSGGRRGRRRS